MTIIRLNKHLINNRDKVIEGKKISNIKITINESNRLRDIQTNELFKEKKIILFALPGAFTPISSEKHLPDFEKNYDKFLTLGINEIYCISVNDTFVMNAWLSYQKIKKVKMLPDGNGDFTRSMGMLIEKNKVGFGIRSWRYCAIINDCVIEKWWQEPGMDIEGNLSGKYEETTPQNCLDYLLKK